MIIQITDSKLKQQITDEILHTLPQWFELEEGIQEYISNVEHNIFFAYKEKDKYIGFVSLKPISNTQLEIYVMGILPKYHRRGIGKKLIHTCKQYMVDNRYTEIIVKTLSSKSKDITMNKLDYFTYLKVLIYTKKLMNGV